MRLGFAIMAHEAAAELAELVDTLIARDCFVSIHYDAKASDEQFRLLTLRYAQSTHVYFAKREPCGWGEFSLVRGTLNCLEAFAIANVQLDYVYLISGADVPVKTLASLKAFLAQALTNETEFIEYHPLDEGSWVKGGLEAERFQYRFFINERRHPIWFTLAWQAQRLLGLRVKPPTGIRLALGAQWWCLTWKTCKSVLDYIKRNPDVYSFFQHTWIPDESFFQTIVGGLVPRERIRNYSLTFYQFSDYCKPHVFFDEHRSILQRFNFFFARKVAFSAKQLRRDLLAQARKPTIDVVSTRAIGTRTFELDAMRIHRREPALGKRAIGRYSDDALSDLPFTDRAIVVILTPCAFIQSSHLRGKHPHENVVFHGHLFSKAGIEFCDDRDIYGGYSRTDTKVRDAHPGSFLARVAGASPKTTAFFATLPEFTVHLAHLLPSANVIFAIVSPHKTKALLTGALLRDNEVGDLEHLHSAAQLHLQADALEQATATLLSFPSNFPAYARVGLLSEYRMLQRIVGAHDPQLTDSLKQAMEGISSFINTVLQEFEASSLCGKIAVLLDTKELARNDARYLQAGAFQCDSCSALPSTVAVKKHQRALAKSSTK